MRKRQRSSDDLFDVVIVGGGTAGWVAALAAARQEKKVLLLERKGYPGGVLGSGLAVYGFHDVNHRQVVRGYADELISRLAEVGGSGGYELLPLWHASMAAVDPALVKPTIVEMLHEAGVTMVLFSQAVDVEVSGARLAGVVVQQKSERRLYRGRRFVDASGDAVLSYLAGAPTLQSDELQPPSLVLRIENVDVNELREHLVAHPDAYVSWRLLPGYEVNAEFLRTCVKFLIYPDRIEQVETRGDYRPLINRFMFTCLPGSSGVSVNMLRARDSDGTSSESLSRATVDLYRNVIPLVEGFRRHVPGFQHCILCDGEPEVQLRETRRIVGEYTLSSDDVLEGRSFDDDIALGGYFIDIHSSRGSGGTWKPISGSYGIPYRVLLPRGLDNVLTAGRCISGEREAAASYRVMATSMAMGQAAGTAAALSIDRDSGPKELDAGALRDLLRRERAILE